MGKSIRTLDNLGRIVIPKDYRKALEIAENDELSLSLSDNKIIIEKLCHSCSFCQSTDELSEFKGKYICQKCKDELLK